MLEVSYSAISERDLQDSGAKRYHDRQTISSLNPQLPYHWEEEEREDGVRQDVEYDDQVIEIASRSASLSIERPRTRQSTLEGYRKKCEEYPSQAQNKNNITFSLRRRARI